MANRIAITGARGRVGNILRVGLKEYSIAELDLPQHDVANPETLARTLRDCGAVIHLARTPACNLLSTEIAEADVALAQGLLEHARVAGVRRVVLASSVHAGPLESESLVRPAEGSPPANAYGATKRRIEELGRSRARAGFEIIALRLGGVPERDHPGYVRRGRWLWLSRSDLIGVVRACLTAPAVPGHFAVLNAVSDLRGRIHDTVNPFGWRPHSRGPLLRVRMLGLMDRALTLGRASPQRAHDRM